MRALERFEPSAAGKIREAIGEAGGNEVLAVGRLNAEGKVADITVAARGNEEAVPVLEPFVREGDVVVHNHPPDRSGRSNLKPSRADLAVASRLGADGTGFYIVDNGVEEVYVVAEPVTRRPLSPLDPDELAGHLGAGGALSRLLPRYEERPSQLSMLRSVCAAFNEGRLCLAEAGTGVGKSLAYLVPAFAWALQNDERVVISTATINLQQQLVDQDVPLVRRVLGRDPGVALVKGRGNYLCLTRLDEARREQSLFEEEERELEALAEWAAATPTGCRSDLPAHVPDEVWQRVCSEADACRGLRCPRREDCFVLRSRREAAAARILIVNHHLLFSDLSLRAAGAGFEGSAVLPPFQRIVFDEAHNIENSATSFFSEAFSRLMIAKYAGRLHRHRKGRALGLLPVLERLTGPGEPIVAIRRALEELQARAETLEAAAFRVMGGASSWRLAAVKGAARDAAPAPLGEMMEAMDELGRSIRSLIQRFEAVFGGLGAEERESGVVYECQIELRRLAAVAEVCDQFLRAAESPGRIFWMEAQKSFRGERYLRFVVTPLEIAELMNEAVYEPYGTVVFTSATLTVGGGFDFWKARVGLAAGGASREDRDTFLEGRFPSPFDYAERVLLAVPEDAPGPEDGGYPAFLAETVRELLKISMGRALVLFTSYASLQETWSRVLPALEELAIPAYRQGDEDRGRLLDRFRRESSSVLFATDSFWEGVDAPGETLQLVILCRLPFRVPSEPVIAARMEAIEERGGNPFAELSLPDAAMRLRQGFGRLMRRSSDWGAVVVLDSRLVRRSYGRVFLSSLPETKRRIQATWSLLEEVRDFFGGMRKKEG